MSEFIIYHNPRCSKSRQTLQLLREKGIEPEIRLYLQQVPDAGELQDLLAKLGIGARENSGSTAKMVFTPGPGCFPGSAGRSFAPRSLGAIQADPVKDKTHETHLG